MPSDDGQIFRDALDSPTTAADFRRFALSQEGVEEHPHTAFGFSYRRQEICFAGLASRELQKSDAYAGAAGEGCA
jgi:hypothetical protein